MAEMGMAGQEYCVLLVMAGAWVWMGMTREEAQAGRRQLWVVVQGNPMHSPEDLSLCSKGTREPWSDIYSGMTWLVLWLMVIADVQTWRD